MVGRFDLYIASFSHHDFSFICSRACRHITYGVVLVTRITIPSASVALN